MLSDHAIHPLIIHFPIAFILLGCVAEFMALSSKEKQFFSEAAWYLIIIGTLTALPAYFSGLYLTEEMTGREGLLRDTHEAWALVTLIAGLITTLCSTYLRMQNLQHTRWEWITAAFYLLTALATVVTGYYGGLLTHGS